ncbi:hypothetical protein A3J90_00570 [candidate division WOR-1 bacterium RIFOXYC2_FULL_37_10]|nr:MAG: hypothetical protein A2246_01305 [candidate division WOR-1 bacterium RIFOXYA2_FULL_37_7]OGC33327.1 MAG: hypothetical protein A3J90_00570 [candidate division WOR-1 bacterium RIFOXYC2_FULL_37_10]
MSYGILRSLKRDLHKPGTSPLPPRNPYTLSQKERTLLTAARDATLKLVQSPSDSPNLYKALLAWKKRGIAHCFGHDPEKANEPRSYLYKLYHLRYEKFPTTDCEELFALAMQCSPDAPLDYVASIRKEFIPDGAVDNNCLLSLATNLHGVERTVNGLTFRFVIRFMIDKNSMKDRLYVGVQVKKNETFLASVGEKEISWNDRIQDEKNGQEIFYFYGADNLRHNYFSDRDWEGLGWIRIISGENHYSPRQITNPTIYVALVQDDCHLVKMAKGKQKTYPEGMELLRQWKHMLAKELESLADKLKFPGIIARTSYGTKTYDHLYNGLWGKRIDENENPAYSQCQDFKLVRAGFEFISSFSADALERDGGGGNKWCSKGIVQLLQNMTF